MTPSETYLVDHRTWCNTGFRTITRAAYTRAAYKVQTMGTTEPRDRTFRICGAAGKRVSGAAARPTGGPSGSPLKSVTSGAWEGGFGALWAGQAASKGIAQRAHRL